METLWLPATETWIDGAGHLGFQMSWGGIYGGILQRALVLRLTFTIQSGRSGGNPVESGPASAEICANYCRSLSVRDGEKAEFVQDRNLGGGKKNK